MANITSVDYQSIPRKAVQIRTYGENINTTCTEIYTSLGNMHASWHGAKYNELVAKFNSIIPTINQLLNLVVGEIPYVLEQVANNYSLADQGQKLVSREQSSPTEIALVASYPGEVGTMKFISEEVDTVKTNVLSKFTEVTEKLNSIESEYNSIDWESEASAAFKSKFETLKSNLVSEFDNISKLFTSLMSQALADIQSAESSNTVG